MVTKNSAVDVKWRAAIFYAHALSVSASRRACTLIHIAGALIAVVIRSHAWIIVSDLLLRRYVVRSKRVPRTYLPISIWDAFLLYALRALVPHFPTPGTNSAGAHRAHSEFVTDLAARESREAEDQGHAPS